MMNFTLSIFLSWKFNVLKKNITMPIDERQKQFTTVYNQKYIVWLYP